MKTLDSGANNSIYRILKNKRTRDRIYYILKERNQVEYSIDIFRSKANTNGIVNVLKELNLWETTGKGEKRTVNIDVCIWVCIMLESHPENYIKLWKGLENNW